MAFKPNYNHQRRERERKKETKKLEKQQRRDAAAAQRKAEREGYEIPPADGEGQIAPEDKTGTAPESESPGIDTESRPDE